MDYQNDKERFYEFMEHNNTAGIKNLISEASYSRLLDLWEELHDDETMTLFKLLTTEQKVNILTALPSGEQELIVEALSNEGMKQLLKQMEPDDLVDLIQSISPEVRRSVWSNISDEARRETQFLLRFDEDDAAGLMTPRYAAVRENLTVSQAIHFIRKHIEETETIYYIYVLDTFKRLIGVVSIREILSTKDDISIRDIMKKNIVTVREETDQEEAARILEENSFIAIPVVDQIGRLLGIITVDDIIDVIREEQTEDIYKMGGMDGKDDDYLKTSVFNLIRKRIPWLAILLLVGSVTTIVLDHYKGMYDTLIVLSLFIPVITQTGGNSGTQSSTLIIRGLATEHIVFKDIGKVILKELAVGFLLGIAVSCIIILRSLIVPPGIDLLPAITVGISLAAVVMFSSMFGAVTPLLIHRAGIDPTVAAAPLMATVIDVCGITIYFELARLILGNLL